MNKTASIDCPFPKQNPIQSHPADTVENWTKGPKFVVGRPNVLDRELFLKRVGQIIDSAVHTNDGPFVKRLETLVQETLAVPHCIAVANATLALELLLQSLAKTGEVIVPSFTFVATVHAIVRSNLRPVFCEVDSRGLIDCDHLEQLINQSTVCILPVNVYGYACNVERLEHLFDQYHIPIVYDSAHALGVKSHATPLGRFGSAEVFSLHATKFISGFEGGLITTRSAKLADKMRVARNFGFVGYDAVECIGTNAKLSEIHAAMALTNLERIDDIINHNRVVFETYSRLLLPPLKLIRPLTTEEPNYQYVPVICPPLLREHVLKTLLANSIFARRYFYPGAHRMKAYEHFNVHLPQTDALSESIICLPSGASVSANDAETISALLNEAVVCLP